MLCLDSELSSERLEAADFFGLEKAWSLAIDVATSALDGADDSVTFEILIRAGDGIGIDAQLSGELSDGGKRIVLPDCLCSDRLLHLGFDLQVERDAGSGMDAY